MSEQVEKPLSLAMERADISISNTPWNSERQATACPNEDDYVGGPVDDAPLVQPGYTCNARRRDGEAFAGYCDNRAGKGTDHVGEGRCSFHGGAADNSGQNNGNYKHGAYSMQLHQELVEWITESDDVSPEAFDDIYDNPAAWRELGCLLAPIGLVKFRRSEDPRHLREFRVVCQAFGLLPAQRGDSHS